MEINGVIVGIVIICVLVLIVFLIRKNQKDKKKYNDFLNEDYKKVADEDSDSDDSNY